MSISTAHIFPSLQVAYDAIRVIKHALLSSFIPGIFAHSPLLSCKKAETIAHFFAQHNKKNPQPHTWQQLRFAKTVTQRLAAICPLSSVNEASVVHPVLPQPSVTAPSTLRHAPGDPKHKERCVCHSLGHQGEPAKDWWVLCADRGRSGIKTQKLKLFLHWRKQGSNNIFLESFTPPHPEPLKNIGLYRIFGERNFAINSALLPKHNINHEMGSLALEIQVWCISCSILFHYKKLHSIIAFTSEDACFVLFLSSGTLYWWSLFAEILSWFPLALWDYLRDNLKSLSSKFDVHPVFSYLDAYMKSPHSNIHIFQILQFHLCTKIEANPYIYDIIYLLDL